MDEIRIVLYLIIITVSLINLISFGRKKKDRKRKSGEIMAGIPPHRTVTPEEQGAVRSLYGIELPPDEKVYAVEGELTALTLNTNHGQTESVHSLGGVVVQWENSHQGFLKESNRAEIIRPARKKGALILNLNGGFALPEEVKIQTALKENSAFAGEKLKIRRSRMVSDREMDHMFPDYRWLPVLLIITLTGAAALTGSLPVRIALSAAALGLFILAFLRDRYPLRYGRRRKELVRLSGRLTGEPGSYTLDRFSLAFPKDWDKDLSPGQEISLEAYPSGTGGYLLHVLSLEPFRSVERDEEINPTRGPHRFILFALLAAAAFVILFFTLQVPEKGTRLVRYIQTRDLPVDYDGWEEISAGLFRKGQYVRLSTDTAFPANEGYGWIYLTDDSPYTQPDWTPLHRGIDRLENLQRTEEFIHLSSYRLGDYGTGYLFLLEAIGAAEPSASLSDFAEDFRDSEEFPLLLEVAEALNWAETHEEYDLVPYPAGGVLRGNALYRMESEEGMTVDYLLRQIKTVPRDFLTEQAERLNGEVAEAWQAFSGERPHIQIYDNRSEISRPSGFDSTNLSLYEFLSSPGREEAYRIREEAEARRVMEEIEKIGYSPLRSWKSIGIIEGVETREGELSSLRIDGFGDYETVKEELIDLIFAFLPLLYGISGLFIYFLGKKIGGSSPA